MTVFFFDRSSPGRLRLDAYLLATVKRTYKREEGTPTMHETETPSRRYGRRQRGKLVWFSLRRGHSLPGHFYDRHFRRRRPRRHPACLVQVSTKKISPWPGAAQTGAGRKRLFITVRFFNSREPRARVRTVLSFCCGPTSQRDRYNMRIVHSDVSNVRGRMSEKMVIDTVPVRNVDVSNIIHYRMMCVINLR